jgi:DUF177 domain-containing protein
MLLIHVSRIPPEGMDIDSSLDPGEVHVEGEETFVLRGGTLRSRLERGDDDSVHVRGHLAASLGLQCGRCLESFDLAVDQELDLFYLPHRPDQELEEEDEVGLSDRDMVVAYHRGDRLDLGEMIREQFFLAIPMKRLCRQGCRGLCPTCGSNRNLVACSCPPEEPSDPRLVPLRELFEKGSS